MKKYFRVWKQLITCSFAATASRRIDGAGYILGKLARFGFFWLFIVSLFRFTPAFVGYTKYQILLFFITFNLVDVLAQAFFRGVYVFRQDVKKGTFDHVLTKPINVMFFTLTRLTDLLDFIFLVPIVGLLVSTLGHLSYTAFDVFVYVYLVVVGLVIILGIHILSVCVTLLTTESEQVIWFYRETMTLGRFPPETLPTTIQWIFTYIFPILVTVSFPAKALLGLLSPLSVMLATIIGACFFLRISSCMAVECSAVYKRGITL